MKAAVDVLEQIQQIRTLIRNPTQQKFYNWILSNGERFSGKFLTQEEEKHLRRLLGSPLYLPKKCFYNCQMIVVSSKEFSYYEGYAQTETLGLNFEHAWLIKDQKVLDPTWKDGIDYFGVEIPQEVVRKSILDTSHALPLVSRFVYDCLKTEEMGDARPETER